MFAIVTVARSQTKLGSLLARPRRKDERPWERGWITYTYYNSSALNSCDFQIE